MNTEFLKELYRKVPQKITINYKNWQGQDIEDTATLDTVVLTDEGNFEIIYRQYIGCGDYENHYRTFTIEELTQGA